MNFLIFLATHLGASALLMILIRAHVLAAPLTIWPLLFCVPWVGEITVIAIHIHTVMGLNGRDQDKLNADRLRNAFHDTGFFQTETRDTSVPVEDALILHKGKQRQTILRNAVLNSISGNQAVLREASRSTDPEIVHFATTALAQADSRDEKIFAGLDKDLAKARRDPDDTDALLSVLDRYIWEMKRCLEETDPMDSLHLVRERRLVALLRERLDLKVSSEALSDLADSCMNLGEPDEAKEPLRQLKEGWPSDPDGWILAFRLRYIRKDRDGMVRMMEEAKDDPKLQNSRIREILTVWEGHL